MAIDPRISLGVQPAGILQAAQQGLQFGQQYAQQKAMNPLQQEALKAQTGQVQAETGKLDIAQKIAGAKYMANTIQNLLQRPEEQRWPQAQAAMPYLQSFGLDTSGITPDQMSDEWLNRSYDVVAPLAQIAQQGQAKGPETVGGTMLIDTPEGPQMVVGSYNNGQFSTLRSPLGGTPITGGGTLQEKNLAELNLEREKLNLERASALRALQEQQQTIVETKQQTAAAEARAKSKNETINEVLSKGAVIQSASKNMTAALELVEGVRDEKGELRKANTGGVQKLLADGKAIFGWSTPDLRELEQLAMGEVIAQLNLMKGVATKSDQEAIAKLGPNPNFGNKDNIVLIKRLLKKYEGEFLLAKSLYSDYKADYPQYKYIYEGGAATKTEAKQPAKAGYIDALEKVKANQAARGKP